MKKRIIFWKKNIKRPTITKLFTQPSIIFSNIDLESDQLKNYRFRLILEIHFLDDIISKCSHISNRLFVNCSQDLVTKYQICHVIVWMRFSRSRSLTSIWYVEDKTKEHFLSSLFWCAHTIELEKKRSRKSMVIWWKLEELTGSRDRTRQMPLKMKFKKNFLVLQFCPFFKNILKKKIKIKSIVL